MLLFLLMLACGGPSEGEGSDGNEEEEEEPKDPRALVEVRAAETGSVGSFLVSNGVVESEAQATLVPEATGTVTAIYVEEGDRVRKGQVLALIENASLDAGLARAEAEAAKAEAELTRVQALHDKGVLSNRDLEESRHLYEAAHTSLVEARGTQSHTRVVSPIAGTVATRELRYGEVAGGQPAFTIVDLERLRVVVKLPERDLASLHAGQEATLTSVYDTDNTVPGSVERISPTVDPMSGTVRATVALDDPELLLRPGQFVSVRIEVGRHDEVLVVPRASIVYEEGEPLVYRVRVEDPPEEEEDAEEEDEPGFFAELFAADEEEEEEEEIPGPYRVARKVPVELGYVDDDLAELITGIEPADDIIAVGHVNLRDEARVRYPEDPVLELKDDEDDDPEDEDDDNGSADAED
ncbi:MAG TPA: efflux RND transporter periplasmic adaptor subunit [Myxococcota bacterium]|nr:efflux RND transporter periplasmic adaptor subunit [Myxococcota bacterium]